MTPEDRRIMEQFNVYYEMRGKLSELKPDYERRSEFVFGSIHHWADEDDWFAEHTPHPFAQVHWSVNHMLASLCCRYLQQSARRGNEDAIRTLADLAVELTETLTELIADETPEADKNAKLVKWIAEELPYWPMLHFRNAAANNHFPRIADKIGLGDKCLVNVSDRANYSLRTPINRLVWRCLRHIKKVQDILAWGEREKKTVAEALAPCIILELPPVRPHPIVPRKNIGGMIHGEEIPIHERCRKLPPLTKSNAEQWADVAIMPLLRVWYPDFYAEPALKMILKQRNPKSRKAELTAVRKAVVQQLGGLARKVSDNPRHSQPHPSFEFSAVLGFTGARRRKF
jgi:hypothetical protein